MNQDIYEELEYIRKQNGGFVRPTDVVDFAKNPDTKLHSHFTWDDSEAAAKYRLAEARSLIRVCVVLNEQTSENVRAFVSLSPDRHDKKGYRAFVDIMDDEILADILLKDALSELASFKRKYEKLREISELSGVFSAIESAESKLSPKDNNDQQISA